MTHHRNLGLFREIGPVLAAFLAPVLRCGQWLLATIPGDFAFDARCYYPESAFKRQGRDGHNERHSLF